MTRPRFAFLLVLALLSGFGLAACNVLDQDDPFGSAEEGTTFTRPSGHVVTIWEDGNGGRYQQLDEYGNIFLPLNSSDEDFRRASPNTGDAGQAHANITLTGPFTGSRKRIAGFKHAQAFGLGTAKLNDEGFISFSITTLLKASEHRAGSLCLDFSGKTADVEHDKALGTFTIVGGSGPAARLYGGGSWRAIETSVRLLGPKGERIIPKQIAFGLTFKRLSTGRARQLTATCERVTKKLPPPSGLTVGFKGFAFASSHATSLPSGTKVYSGGSTISGNVGCGSDDELFAVFDYKGPKGTGLGYAAVSSDGAKSGGDTTLRSGTQLLSLYSDPANGGYDFYYDASPPPGFNPPGEQSTTFTLSRSC